MNKDPLNLDQINQLYYLLREFILEKHQHLMR
jgi:hypothetical protein